MVLTADSGEIFCFGGGSCG